MGQRPRTPLPLTLLDPGLTPSVQTVLRRNRDRLLERIERACAKAGRTGPAAELLAVTKSVTSKVSLELVRVGQTDLGENRIDVLEEKRADFGAAGVSATWHFIGHIQRNKAARVVRAADVIHSVDSIRLATALDRHAREAGRRLSIYLQVKLTEDEAKHGLSETQLSEAIELSQKYSNLDLLGLMTMAPLILATSEARSAARSTFERLSEIAAGLPSERFVSERPKLSMGMSGDFEEAIAAGADIVRVGSALFEGIDESELRRPKPASGDLA